MTAETKTSWLSGIIYLMPRPPLWRRVLLGLPLLALGLAIAVFMGISVVLEIMTDDFFGMCVAGLVSFSGLLIAKEGGFLLFGLRSKRTRPVVSDYHRAAYAPSMGHPKGMPPEPARCAAVVYEQWQCPNPRGHGPQEAFCPRHARTHENRGAKST